MKTAELTGTSLDYWVARADGYVARSVPVRDGEQLIVETIEGNFVGYIGSGYLPRYAPSIDWAQGGPIVERERIAIVCNRPYSHTNESAYWDAYYDGRYSGPDGQVNCKGDISEGPTPLIAAMRAFVASKYGDTVSDPP